MIQVTMRGRAVSEATVVGMRGVLEPLVNYLTANSIELPLDILLRDKSGNDKPLILTPHAWDEKVLRGAINEEARRLKALRQDANLRNAEAKGLHGLRGNGK